VLGCPGPALEGHRPAAVQGPSDQCPCQLAPGLLPSKSQRTLGSLHDCPATASITGLLPPSLWRRYAKQLGALSTGNHCLTTGLVWSINHSMIVGHCQLDTVTWSITQGRQVMPLIFEPSQQSGVRVMGASWT
jgi:hypothetical protein